MNKDKVNKVAPNDFIKSKGKGTNLWDPEEYKITWLEEELDKDELFVYFKNKANRENFFWTSHCFTHENLNNATRSDALNEVLVNLRMATRLQLLEEKGWSKNSIITPHSSGLHNVDVLEVFKKMNIEVAGGNIYRSDISNSEDDESGAYLPWRSTLKNSGYDGFMVIPRIPTHFCRQCSTSYEVMYKYNEAMKNTGIVSSYDDIMSHHSHTALKHIFQLHSYPFQFHQANIRSADLSEGKSLFQSWTDEIIRNYNLYVNWPVVSINMDNLKLKYEAREELKKCDLDINLIYNSTYITGISITAGDVCRVPITLPDGVELDSSDSMKYYSKITIEKLSLSDPVTLWVYMNRDTKTINFNPALLWNSEKENNINLSSLSSENNNNTAESEKENTSSDTPVNVQKETVSSLVRNIVTNVLSYGQEINKALSDGEVTSQQLKNIKALSEISKSKNYAKEKDNDKIKLEMIETKNKFYLDIQEKEDN